MGNLRTKIIKLAYNNHELRSDLLPLVCSKTAQKTHLASKKITARKDRELLAVGQMVYQKLLKAINQKPSLLVPNGANLRQFVLDGVKLGLPGLVIIFDPDATQSFNSKSSNREDIIVIGLRGLGIRLGDGMSDQQAALKAMKKHKNVIIHELIHYMDSRRMGQKSWTSALKNYMLPDKDTVAYFNHPVELNAYFLQALLDVSEGIEESLSNINPQKNDNSHQVAVMELDDWLVDYGKFQNFQKKFWRAYHKVAKQFLTPQNKRRQDKRIYDTWSKLHQEIKKIIDSLIRSGDEMAQMLGA